MKCKLVAVGMLLSLLLLLGACDSQRPEVPEISEAQITQMEQTVLNASQHVQRDGVWIYVSTGDSGLEEPATIVSVQLNPNTRVEDIGADLVNITASMKDIEFEIPLGHLVITYSGSDNRPVLVYMTVDLASCTLTDYRGEEPVLTEFDTIDELEKAFNK